MRNLQGVCAFCPELHSFVQLIHIKQAEINWSDPLISCCNSSQLHAHFYSEQKPKGLTLMYLIIIFCHQFKFSCTFPPNDLCWKPDGSFLCLLPLCAWLSSDVSSRWHLLLSFVFETQMEAVREPLSVSAELLWHLLARRLRFKLQTMGTLKSNRHSFFSSVTSCFPPTSTACCPHRRRG